MLRRPRAARVPLGGDAALAGVDRLRSSATRSVRLWHQTLGMSKSQVVQGARRRGPLAAASSSPSSRCATTSWTRWSRDHRALASPCCSTATPRRSISSPTISRARGNVDVRPKAIMSSAQTLPEGSRKLIEEAFGCKVFDKYGAASSRASPTSARRTTGHHVVGEGYIVEVLRDGRARPSRARSARSSSPISTTTACRSSATASAISAEAMDPTAPAPAGAALPRVGNIEGRVQSIIQGTRRAVTCRARSSRTT